MEGTLQIGNSHLENPVNLHQLILFFVMKFKENTYLPRHAKIRSWSNYTFVMPFLAKLSKFRILPFSEIVLRGQNPKFVKVTYNFW